MTENFNLYPLHVFRLVARHGSVTRAAKELCISQPAASSHIRTLEAQYGTLLFERTPQGMRLTPVGLAVAERANRLFAEWEDIGEAIKSTSGEVRGEVTIAASTTPGAYLLPKLLCRFKARYPGAEPTLLIGDSAQVVGWLREYRAPLGVLGEMYPQVEGADWTRARFAADELRLVAAIDSPLCGLFTIQPDQLHNQTLFLREQGSSTRGGAEELLRGWLDKFGRVVETTSAETIKEAVIAGLGVAVLSSLTTQREEKGRLVSPVKDKRFHRERSFDLAHRSNRPPVGAAAALWQFLLAELETT